MTKEAIAHYKGSDKVTLEYNDHLTTIEHLSPSYHRETFITIAKITYWMLESVINKVSNSSTQTTTTISHK